MKRAFFTASTLLILATGGFAGVPDEPTPPVPPTPPTVEKPTTELRAKAEAAIKSEIVEILNKANENLPAFTRWGPYSYTLSLTETAPGEVTATAERLPFQIFRNQRNVLPPKQPAPAAKPQGTPALAGYYDAGKAAVLVYNETSKTYLPAAEHPLVARSKARLK